MNPGLRLADDGLFSNDLTPVEKIVLAALQAPYRRDDSLDWLDSRLPLGRNAISAARRSLEAKGVIKTDRSGYKRSKRIRWIKPAYEHNLHHGRRKSIWLPGEIVEALRPRNRGDRRVTSSILLAMLYTREQARRGGIHISDATAAQALGLTKREVGTARRRLLQLGVVKGTGHAIQRTPVLTMPAIGTTPIVNGKTKINPLMTLRVWDLDGETIVASTPDFNRLVAERRNAVPDTPDDHDPDTHIDPEDPEDLTAFLASLERPRVEPQIHRRADPFSTSPSASRTSPDGDWQEAEDEEQRVQFEAAAIAVAELEELAVTEAMAKPPDTPEAELVDVAAPLPKKLNVDPKLQDLWRQRDDGTITQAEYDRLALELTPF